PGKVGRKVSSVHHGLAGECDLEFSPDINPKNLDVIFIDAHSDVADRFRMNTDRWPDLRIIDMSHCPSLDFDALDMAYGLPEINRKQLVRGCRRAVVPRSVAAAAIIGLYPLARHLLLKGDIIVEYVCPSDIVTEEKMNMVRQEILYVLGKTQNSFSGDIRLHRLDEEISERGLKVVVEIPCTLDITEVFKLFDDCYDDHNFTFMVASAMPGYEVEGTQKTLVTLQKQKSDRLTVTVIADCRMRGGAGDAVHIMNLLFGLHERTGLYLKAHKF
ncbi:MAG: hypothetical protein K2K23_10940, partial [Muribaculaceae bacterium]|nr:hypothetical protein [Muribaculaceae bacterium]